MNRCLIATDKLRLLLIHSRPACCARKNTFLFFHYNRCNDFRFLQTVCLEIRFWKIKIVFFQSGIICFTIEKSCVSIWSLTKILPGIVIGNNCFLMSVFIGDHQSPKEGWPVAPVVIIVQTETEWITPPSGCKNTAQTILTFLHQICHIVSLIHQMAVILTCARCKIFLCHAFSIHAAFIDSTCSCIQSRTCHFAIHCKVGTKHWQRKTTQVGNLQTFSFKSLSVFGINRKNLCAWFSKIPYTNSLIFCLTVSTYIISHLAETRKCCNVK